ncbi:MAG: Fic family protein [Rhodospirillaceae bacterium]|nr:Fic family protein [Rhodospirillaceae bacterium]
MARRIREEDLRAIEEVVRSHPDGMTARQIAKALKDAPAHRTLQYWLKSLVDSKRLAMEGSGRGARYRTLRDTDIAVQFVAGRPKIGVLFEGGVSFSEAADEVRNYVRQPVEARAPVGYDPAFLESYRPNDTHYLSEAERGHLRDVGASLAVAEPAGTYARQVLNRLLIDLSWNSSRLEGNTYSLLDTKRLIEAGAEAEGKDRRDTQMILNHKEAIEFLVDAAADIGFNRYTILNLHAALADGLLDDPDAAGRLRHIPVGITQSVFHPLEVPQLIEECFDRILVKASAIEDPFEQVFFALVQLPYLQPFDDVNKRVSRLAANIPLIEANLSPLSFEDVSRDLYTEAVLGVYELNRVELLRDVFVWAYERSAARYAAVRQSLGEPDPFRMRHRAALRELVSAVVRDCMDTGQAATAVEEWVGKSIAEQERERFRTMVERELLSLHEGNFARYRIKPSEFAAWQEAWKK